MGSKAVRTENALSSRRQYRLKPCGYYRMTVSAWTMTRIERQFDQKRDSQTQKMRWRLQSR